MSNAPSKGIAQTLQDVLNNLQKQVKEKTVALDAANKKILALSQDKGGDFTVELDKEKEKRTETEKLFKDAKAEISLLKKQMDEASSNGKGADSSELIEQLEKRTRAEKELAERTGELAEANKKLDAETQARINIETELKNSSGDGDALRAENQKEAALREKAETALQEAQS